MWLLSMPKTYFLKVLLAAVAFVLATAPFAHSAWNYFWASRTPDITPEMRTRRREAAYEWKGWKIFCTGVALIINTIINMIP